MATAIRTLRVCTSGRPCSATKALLDAASIFGFKSSQAGIEQLALRHDDHVEAGSDLVATENLSNQSFGPVPRNGAPELFGGGNTKSANGKRVRQHEQSAELPVNPGAPIVNLLKFRASAKVFVSPKRITHC